MQKYKGIFNWHGQVFTLQTQKSVKGPDQALASLIYGLSKQLGRTHSSVLNYFLGKPNSYEILPIRSEP